MGVVNGWFFLTFYFVLVKYPIDNHFTNLYFPISNVVNMPRNLVTYTNPIVFLNVLEKDIMLKDK